MTGAASASPASQPAIGYDYDTFAADLNTLLTRVDALGTAVSNASEAYQGVDLALAKRLAHHRGVA